MPISSKILFVTDNSPSHAKYEDDDDVSAKTCKFEDVSDSENKQVRRTRNE